MGFLAIFFLVVVFDVIRLDFGTKKKWWWKEMMDWVDAGYPSRIEWEKLKTRFGKKNSRLILCGRSHDDGYCDRNAKVMPQLRTQAPALGADDQRDSGLERGVLSENQADDPPGKRLRTLEREGGRSMTAIDNDVVLLDVEQVAAATKLHRATVYKLVACGKFPPPIKLGRATRWIKDELLAWVDAKCPSMAKWEAMKGRPAIKNGKHT